MEKRVPMDEPRSLVTSEGEFLAKIVTFVAESRRELQTRKMRAVAPVEAFEASSSRVQVTRRFSPFALPFYFICLFFFPRVLARLFFSPGASKEADEWRRMSAQSTVYIMLNANTHTMMINSSLAEKIEANC